MSHGLKVADNQAPRLEMEWLVIWQMTRPFDDTLSHNQTANLSLVSLTRPCLLQKTLDMAHNVSH